MSLEKIFENDIPDEWRWERIRNLRNQLLIESDAKMVSDAPWDITAWATYRQKLRDLPTTVLDPLKIKFPQPPQI